MLDNATRSKVTQGFQRLGRAANKLQHQIIQARGMILQVQSGVKVHSSHWVSFPTGWKSCDVKDVHALCSERGALTYEKRLAMFRGDRYTGTVVAASRVIGQ